MDINAKGIDFYSFLSNPNNDFEIKTRLKQQERVLKKADSNADMKFECNHFSIENQETDNPIAFILSLYHKQQKVEEITINLNAKNGSINDKDLNKLMSPSIIKKNYCFCFGIYYSDGGQTLPYPNHHIYAVVAENQSNWMSKLFTEISNGDLGENLTMEQIKLNNLVLPGVHDAGMYLSLPDKKYFGGLANTQKDNIVNQLALGARILDFRPGKLPKKFGEKLVNAQDLGPYKDIIKLVGGGFLDDEFAEYINIARHLHMFVPGETLENFATGIIDFLVKNQQEIVILNLATNGFTDAPWVIPVTKEEIQETISDLIKDKQVSLNIGGKEDFESPISDLLKQSKRLILTGKMIDDLNSKGSYSDSGNTSLNPENLTRAIGSLINDGKWENSEVIEFSLQLTANGLTEGIYRIINENGQTKSQTASPLLSTKPVADAITYSWLPSQKDKINQKAHILLTMYNDFYDCGMTEISKILSKSRIKSLS